MYDGRLNPCPVLGATVTVTDREDEATSLTRDAMSCRRNQVAELPEVPADGSDPGSDPAMVGPLVVHQGRLLVFGIPMGTGPAPLWETDLQGLLDQG